MVALYNGQNLKNYDVLLVKAGKKKRFYENIGSRETGC